jgi:hypothetical protein
MNREGKLRIRALEFFYFLPALGFLGFGMIGILVRWKQLRHRNEMRLAERLLECSGWMIIVFVLLMFKGASTVLHQGTYASVLMAMAASILAFRAAAPITAVAVCACQCLFTWMLYEPDLSQAFPSSLTVRASPWMMALHAFAVLGFFAMLALNPPSRTRRYQNDAGQTRNA